MATTIDLVLAADQANLRNGRTIIGMAERQPEIRLLRDFDPAAVGRDLDDPWGYPPAEYERVAAEISAAIPGLLAELRDRV
jgi:protein-tyrosine phosphatase